MLLREATLEALPVQPPRIGKASVPPRQRQVFTARVAERPVIREGQREAQGEHLRQLMLSARRALANLRPAGPIVERGFLLDDHAVILLAARVDGAPRVPRDVELIRLTLALGTGLQLRTIGGLALVAIQMPTVDRRWIANRQGSGLLAV